MIPDKILALIKLVGAIIMNTSGNHGMEQLVDCHTLAMERRAFTDTLRNATNKQRTV